MARSEGCSELEFMVLAMIASDVTSGYAMRKYIVSLHGSRWSTDSGSIYRALGRLKEAGLVEISGRAGSPNRQRTEYKLTAQGTKQFRNWMSTPIESELMVVVDDPVRARASFLLQVPENQRKDVVKKWLSDTNKLLQQVDKEIQDLYNKGKSFEGAILDGYRLQVETRANWLTLLSGKL